MCSRCKANYCPVNAKTNLFDVLQEAQVVVFIEEGQLKVTVEVGAVGEPPTVRLNLQLCPLVGESILGALTHCNMNTSH